MMSWLTKAAPTFEASDPAAIHRGDEGPGFRAVFRQCISHIRGNTLVYDAGRLARVRTIAKVKDLAGVYVSVLGQKFGG
jgi:hypothetical protein